MSDLDRIRSALDFIPAHDREVWLRMGMAVKSELGEEGFPLWDEWSRQSDSYRERDAASTWRSIRANGKVTAGTLFHEAKAHGWRNGGAYRIPTPEQVAERKRLAEEKAAEDAALLAGKRAEAAQKAVALWKATSTAAAGNPYLRRKNVPAVDTLHEIEADDAAKLLGYAPKEDDEYLVGRLLAVPVKVGDSISTLELIDGQGRKSALAGGAKADGYWAAQKLPEGDDSGLTLMIAEGVGTALSCRQATGHPVIAALSCGNLKAVALAMRERYPKATIRVIGDLGNGQEAAADAARAAGALLALPDFGDGREDGDSDMNDLWNRCGAAAVYEALQRACVPEAPVTGIEAHNALVLLC